MERGLEIILSSHTTLGSFPASSPILIMDHLLHLHESQITIMPTMTHQLGAITGVGIDLHLGQNPKLGGRYADDSLIYTSYLVGTLYIHVSLFFLFFAVLVLISTFQNTQRPKIFLLFLFVFFFSFLVLVCFIFYFRFGIQKIQKDFAFCCFLLFLFQNSKIQKYLMFFSGFVKFVAEFSLP
jgi:hypothetical protein